MYVDWEYYKIFYYVAKYQNFTKAARVLGSGTWLGFQVLPDSIARISIMTQAPGAFFCYGVLMAGCVWLEGKLDARIERKSCCDIDNLKKEG